MPSTDLHRRRFVTRTLASGLALASAGCLAGSGGGRPTSTGPATGADTTTPPGPATETGTPTFDQTYPTDVGTGDDPVDLWVANGTAETRRIEVRVSAESSEEVPFDETFELRPGKHRYIDLFGHRATGVYRVAVRTDSGASGSYTWDLQERPAGGRLSVAVDDEGVDFGYSIA
ncbi:hypothetical protein [Haloarchaeobius amylolyticus]|uniref:hypothetical protein n=1 Tax=Haloarchaeobius amylolyticus TaxID=1198296 RepID=UPI00226DED93|nr:hypothetical protein [Haloarchaeobius amylolyticus]